MELALITRPVDLIYKKVDLYFNCEFFSMLEIDLEHINQGRLSSRRSRFTSEQVMEVVLTLLENERLIFEDKKEYGRESCSYYQKIGKFNERSYKLVFCICSDRPKTIGIITLFRLGGNYEPI